MNYKSPTRKGKFTAFRWQEIDFVYWDKIAKRRGVSLAQIVREALESFKKENLCK